MNSFRFPAPSPSSTPEFGLVAWLEKTRVVLPLKGVECRFQITGAIASVQLDQIYHQDNAQPLDCTYTFPLPADAAVYRCELHVNGRVIRAIVEDKESARRIYRAQKAAGRRAALVETERDNLFTLSVGNLQPGDLIVVRFAWFQTLDRNGAGLRLMIPTCPGVRYIPGTPLLRDPSGRGTADDTTQVPDASRITPSRIDALHRDAAYFSIEGRLSPTDAESGTVSSPSHSILVRAIDGVISVGLTSGGSVPDRDFVLVWQEPKARQLGSQAWHWNHAGETYALVQLRAPENATAPVGLEQDFYFLVDRSGSMQGVKWGRTCEALHAFVALLGPKDRVSITFFESDFRDFAEAPMPAPHALADRGFQRMKALGTGGGTELLPAAAHALELIDAHSAGRRTAVVLITDGQVGNEREVLAAFNQRAASLTVHTFGIDTAVNDAFLKNLAAQNRGGCWLQTPDDDIAGTIAALGDRLRRPVVTDLALRGGWEASRENWPDLHAGEVVMLSMRGKSSDNLEIVGRLPDGTDHRFTMNPGPVGSEAVMLFWAKDRIATLLRSNDRAGAIALAKQYNLLCEGAAFIAWDEAEKVAVAEEEIYQPAMDGISTLVKHACKSVQFGDIGALGEDFFGPSEFGGGSVFSDVLATPSQSLPGQSRDDQLFDHIRSHMHRAGVTDAEADPLISYVRSNPEPDRVMALEHSILQIFLIRCSGGQTASYRDALEPGIVQALAGPPPALLKWGEEMGLLLQGLIELHEVLVSAETPAKVIEKILGWIVETGADWTDRRQKAEVLVQTLQRLPFSMTAKLPPWREFLNTNLDKSSAVAVAVQTWLSELESTLSSVK